MLVSGPDWATTGAGGAASWLPEMEAEESYYVQYGI
jgi:hypothetical protein